jgi:hypothetical protein
MMANETNKKEEDILTTEITGKEEKTSEPQRRKGRKEIQHKH